MSNLTVQEESVLQPSEEEFKAYATIAKKSASEIIIDLEMPVVGGYGQKKILTATSKLAAVTTKLTGTILNPPKGNWRIRVNNEKDNKTLFDKSGLIFDFLFTSDDIIFEKTKPLVVCAEAWWSEKENTTLEVEIKIEIFTPF